MKKTLVVMAAAGLALAPLGAAHAGWKLVDGGAAVAVAKGSLKITPGQDWNRWTVKPIKTGEVWTLDGPTLNELYLITDLAPGSTLYRDANKKDRPLPKFEQGMDLTDLPDLVERSNRVALGTSVYETTAVAPATLGGQPAVRFDFTYAVEGSALKRQGMGVATIVGGKLHAMTFTAPQTFYFERDRAEVERIFASARF